jgi:hypothetical protein
MLRRTIHPAVALAVAFLTALTAAPPADAVWTNKTRLTWTAESEEYPRIAAVECVVHVVWIDLDKRDLHYTRSSDAGATWSEPRILATGSGVPIIQAEIAASGRQVHVVWQQGASDQARIHHRRSTNRGKSWRRPRSLSTAGKASEQPTVAVDGKGVHVAWIQTRHGSDTKPVKLFMTRSQNRGKDWTSPERLDRRSLGLATPLLATGGGRVHFFWGRRVYVDGTWTLQVLSRSSTDGGSTWSPRRQVVGEGWRLSSVAVDGHTLHLLWENGQYKLSWVEYQRSHDAGKTWTEAQRLDEGSLASLDVLGDRLEAAWVRDWDGTGPLIYSRSTDGGRTWPIRRQIGRVTRFPNLTLAGGQGRCAGAAHLTYGKKWVRDELSFQEIFHRREPQRLDE